MRKFTIYKYKKDWEKEEWARGWLREATEKVNRYKTVNEAYCEVCKITLRAHHTDLKRHSTCKRHQEIYSREEHKKMNVCRTCLRTTENMVPLPLDLKLVKMIEAISCIEITLENGFPNKVCSECIININLSYNFRRIIVNSDKELRSRYDNQNVESNANGLEDPLDVKGEKSNGDYLDLFSETLLNDDSTLIKQEEVDLEENEFQEANPGQNEMQKPDLKQNELHGTDLEQYVLQEKLPEQNELQQTEKKVVSKGKRLRKCNTCEFETYVRNKYHAHMQKHIKRICTICGKLLVASNYTKHINRHSDAPVTCKVCGKAFRNKEFLSNHLIFHSEKLRKCKICGEEYRKRSEYVAHLKTHKSKEEMAVKCPICNKTLSERSCLQGHMRSHTGERPYSCDVCHKGLSSSNALKTHRRMHTKEKPYGCAWCPMRFPQRVSLRTHLKSKHRQNY